MTDKTFTKLKARIALWWPVLGVLAILVYVIRGDAG